MANKWPKGVCDRCNKEIRLVRTRSGWQAFEVDAFEKHLCGEDVYDLPDYKLLHLFIPRKRK
jgi:hypothetical protein